MIAEPVFIGLLLDIGYAVFRRISLGIRAFGDTQPNWLFIPTSMKRGQVVSYGAAQLDGIISNVNTPARREAVSALGIPVVNVGGQMPDLPFATVHIDNTAVGRLAAEHLLERGLSRFAYVGHPRFLTSLQREAAFRDVIGDAGYTVTCYHSDPRRHFVTDARQGYLGNRVHRWLLDLPKPVGLFVPGDFWGVELTHICRQLELRIPEDVAVVSVNDDELHCEFSRPKLSSIVLPAERVGFEAGVVLERLIAGVEPLVREQFLSPLFVRERRSSEALAVDDEDVVAAARFIRERGHLPITVTDVVREISLSRRALERRFHRALGRGLAQEINRVRLQRCKHLLVETDFDMPSIARQCGFSSARHMAVSFRREMKTSPTDYRREARVTPAQEPEERSPKKLP